MLFLNRSFLKSVVVAAALATAPLVAHAQTAAQPSAAAIGLAKDIIAIKGGGDVIETVVPAAVEQAKLMFLQTNLNLQKDLTEVATKVYADLKARSQEPLNEMARLYATSFTEAELKDMLAFYKTPLGKKMLEAEPKVIQSSMQFADGWAQKLEPEVVDRFRTEMKKRGKDL